MKNQTSIDQTITNEKNIAIIAYVTIIGLIIAFIINSEKKNTFTSYHIKQSLGIALTSLSLMVVGVIPLLGWLISILGCFFVAFLWVMGLINAVNNKKQPVPVLGKKFEVWFKKL
ncbi:DUF4870 domain-containing protein [Lacinutrix sp. 5H-3-7-4]|uniref:DUF4870 domain-containing protein n=1 Tax=Lacinutrix sp. (strain 5H-3-7-4) TaxID=983544 RepID=UPI00020A3D78|nr:hypothetical protein [Lacinutrix sp. 5H-3-7-4]AEH01507.1 hypothetical protein Lacal_1659 [Lacinutrix sp. 5H-3-7-4]